MPNAAYQYLLVAYSTHLLLFRKVHDPEAAACQKRTPIIAIRFDSLHDATKKLLFSIPLLDDQPYGEDDYLEHRAERGCLANPP